MIQRRRFLHLSGAAALVSAAGSLRSGRAAAQDTLVDRALAAGQDRVVLGSDAGAYIDLIYRHFFDPFTEDSGITVDVVGGSAAERVARLRAMNAIGNVEWDMVLLDPNDAQNPAFTQYLVDFGEDCADLPNLVANGLDGACVRYGVELDMGGLVLAYDETDFPDDGPQNWADFWDVDRFPGPRSLPDYGRPWSVLIPALLADGVPRDALFPLDLDRAFRKLDILRPHIAAWWSSGDHSQQLFRSREVVMGMLFSNRAGQLRAQGFPVNYTWNQALLGGGPFCVLRDAPRPLAALALLNFLFTRPEAHADYMTAARLATFMRGADDFLDPDVGSRQVTSPENWSRVVRVDPHWLAGHRRALVERWTNWISG